MKERKFFSGILNHCYQRTVGGIPLFYSVSDFLVYFTIFCTTAPKYDVVILALCLMPDHIHQSTIAGSIKELVRFIQEVSSKYSHVYNSLCLRKGPLFEKSFGSAPKTGDKKARTNLIYIGNNAPERRLCSKAEEYKWNFIAYARNSNPFSEKLILASASKAMRRAVAEIKYQNKQGKPLTYRQLQRLFASLDMNERKQLVDFIIMTYNIIDHEAAIRFFSSYEDMLLSMHANTGSEYDINEVFVGKSDACYAKMAQILRKELGIQDIHDIFVLTEGERISLLPRLLGRTEATPGQVASFLQVPLSRYVNGQPVGRTFRSSQSARGGKVAESEAVTRNPML